MGKKGELMQKNLEEQTEKERKTKKRATIPTHLLMSIMHSMDTTQRSLHLPTSTTYHIWLENFLSMNIFEILVKHA